MAKLKKWARALYQPNLPLYEDRRVTASKEHIELSRRAASEGMVLLKNTDNILPFKPQSRLALFGKGSIDYVKGGGGSGDVYCPYVRNIYDGLRDKADISIYEPLMDFYEDYVRSLYDKGENPGLIAEPDIADDLITGARNFTDTAVLVLSRYSSEGWDRSGVECNNEFNPWESEISMPKKAKSIFPKLDYYLTDEEESLLSKIREAFDEIVVVLNVGGVVDTRWIRNDEKIKGTLLAWQAGMEGGAAIADILCGDVNPSGKLPDTFAGRLDDYPSTSGFHDSFDYVEYTEDIYVGYRYFETIPGADEKVVYPFGHGLSYTKFESECIRSDITRDEVSFVVRITNRGQMAGRDVAFIYYEAPQGKLGKPRRELLCFAKTSYLKPGESQEILLEEKTSMMASFDDEGAVNRSAFVLEKGEYNFYLGGDVHSAEKINATLNLNEDMCVEKCESLLAPTSLSKRMRPDGTYLKLETTEPHDKNECIFERIQNGQDEAIIPAVRAMERCLIMDVVKKGTHPLLDVADGKISIDEFAEQLNDDELIHLLGGQPNTGVANVFGIGNLPEYGIPSLMTADGPAGVRLSGDTGVSTTAWPCATLLASTFDAELIYEVGRAGGEELKENNLHVWLTPGMNIHRNPMCGRNFEYLSEDPVVSGRIGAALVLGIQSVGVSACPKHFAANNKETNRKHSDSRVSERALREIYLKGFKMMIDEAHPLAIMSSYNAINGYRVSESYELLTRILREEWGYDGLVVSDWWNRAEHYREILAGNDVKMGTGYPERVKEAMRQGAISREDLLANAKRVIKFILSMD